MVIVNALHFLVHIFGQVMTIHSDESIDKNGEFLDGIGVLHSQIRMFEVVFIIEDCTRDDSNETCISKLLIKKNGDGMDCFTSLFRESEIVGKNMNSGQLDSFYAGLVNLVDDFFVLTKTNHRAIDIVRLFEILGFIGEVELLACVDTLLKLKTIFLKPTSKFPTKNSLRA